MNTEERMVRIALAAVDGIGRKTLQKIKSFVLDHQLEWREIWQSKRYWPEVFLGTSQQLQLREFQKKYTPEGYVELLKEKEISVVLEGEENYPKLLREIPDKPEILYLKGPLQAQTPVPIAVVGTRHPTGYGEMATQRIVHDVVQVGGTIISGFMYGIDLCAHKAAVRAQGYSIGVLGFGFDTVYPAQEKEFFEEFIHRGNTLLTEFAPHVSVSKGNFPVRNRVVAGLSQAVVVVEAAHGSGSLITAQLALDYNRLVCAVPGSIMSPYSQGTKQLLREGAVLVGSGKEVLQELQYTPFPDQEKQKEKSLEKKNKELSSLDQNILHTLKSYDYSANQLSQALSQPLSEILSVLTQLELRGIVKRDGPFWHAEYIF